MRKMGAGELRDYVICSLPEEVAPEYQQIFPAYVWNGTGKERFTVYPSGDIKLFYGPTDGREYEVSISNIHFRPKDK